MRTFVRSTSLLGLFLVFASCSERGTVEPTMVRPQLSSSVLPSVRIAEFHYDNTGTDVDEKVEISGPAGTDLSGWSLVLYNGNVNSRAPYTTTSLSGAIPATCGPRGVIVISYGTNGIQNGGTSATGVTDPDGFALVDNNGAVVEFISYEGSFVASIGPAAGMVSTDIGVRELGNEQAPPVFSLQRDGDGNWSGPILNTFDVCNDDVSTPVGPIATVTITPASATVLQDSTQQFSAAAFDANGRQVTTAAFAWSSAQPSIASVNANGLATALQPGDAEIIATAPNGVADTAALHVNAPPPPGTLPDTRISEVHYDNFGTDVGEAIEVEGPAGTALNGWSIVLYNGNGGVAYNTSPLSGVIPDLCNGRGVVVVTYPQDGIQNGSPDGMALIDANGAVVEFLSYEGTFIAADGPAAGRTSIDIGVLESSSPAGQSLQRDSVGTWSGPKAATIGACNSAPPLPPTNTISFTGRLASDPALPVGFEDQVFATERDPSNVVIPTTFTWLSETPAIATIDPDGVIHALSAGTGVFRATAADGTTASHALPIRVAVASTTASYAGNAEFGEPTDNDASDDFIGRRDQYTFSFSSTRGTPNWVSYNLEVTHFGPEDRCDCFTFDPDLPAGFTHYTTADYTGAGAFHGFGIDRGHLARSFDRTSASLDNATTFYFSNIIPQAADLNQGPWAAFETFLGDLARFQNKEVYIAAGVAGSKGTIKNQGKIVIPAQVWKVAVIMPRDQGLAQATSPNSVNVIAVIMPNESGVRNVNWETYKTTVDAIEALSGYDLLALLPDNVEIPVESGTHAPVAQLDGPYTSLEGSSVGMSGAASSDADAQPLTFAWSFGDGASATGATTSHTYTQDGTYTVRLIATDPLGVADTVTTNATVANVAPAVAAFNGATLLPGETYSASGTFTDPGADMWSATVDYGDGSGVSALALSGKTFALSHTYNTAGTVTVTVRVADDDVTGTRTQTVTVLTQSQGVQNAIDLVRQLVAVGKLNSGNGNALESKLNTAKKQIDAGKPSAAIPPLQLELDQLADFVRDDKLGAADADPLIQLVTRILQSIH